MHYGACFSSKSSNIVHVWHDMYAWQVLSECTKLYLVLYKTITENTYLFIIISEHLFGVIVSDTSTDLSFTMYLWMVGGEAGGAIYFMTDWH